MLLISNSVQNLAHQMGSVAKPQSLMLKRGWRWADKKLDTNHSLFALDQRAVFLLHLPLGHETWKRLEGYESDIVALYWTQFPPRVEDPADCSSAVEQLLARGRAWEALVLIEPF